MTTLRNALLGACLALPLAAPGGPAQAARPQGGRVIYVPPGATVVILPGPGAVAAPNMVSAGMVSAGVSPATPMLRLIAQQAAAMQRVIANMNAMFLPLPGPGQLLRAAFGSGAPLNVSFAPLAGGPGVCSQRISIVDRGDGSAPVVTTSQSGDACGAPDAGKPRGVNQIGPAALPHGPKLLEIGDPPRPVSNGTPPRT
ncbi:MAG TPA: hypothetical protein VND19_01570 [Acetobacteraceae bacterium]|nr:hypothetical protein [Acetobacteraceae bacterium]